MKRPAMCSCHCAPPVLFDWSRICRAVGVEYPCYELPHHSAPWYQSLLGVSPPQDLRAADPYRDQSNFPFDSYRTFYMQPVRYEIGKRSDVDSSTIKVGNMQVVDGVSDFSIPTHGHVDTSTVVSVDVPSFIYRGTGSVCQAYINAVDVMRNGTREQLFIFDSPIECNLTTTISTWRGAIIPRLTFDTPIVVSDSDTWSFDLYSTAVIDWYDTLSDDQVVAVWGSGRNGLGRLTFQSAATLFGHSFVHGLKFVFASNGPGGITELTMEPQTGWTYEELTAASFKMTNTAGTIWIEFHWNKEIPVIIYNDVSKLGSPSGFGYGVRYRPNDSSDYDPFYVYDPFLTNPAIETAYGIWNPAGTTVFGHLWRQGGSIAPFTYANGNILSTGFPSSISVEPA